MPQDTPSRKLDQYIIRFPDGMRDQLKAAAESNKRSMNAEIVARLQQTFDMPLGVDLTSSAVQDAMIERLHAVMGGVVEDMREEQRIASGIPLLVKWFDAHPDERAEYDEMSDDEQDVFVREKAHELWLEHINAKRQARSGRARVAAKGAFGPPFSSDELQRDTGRNRNKTAPQPVGSSLEQGPADAPQGRQRAYMDIEKQGSGSRSKPTRKLSGPAVAKPKR